MMDYLSYHATHSFIIQIVFRAYPQLEWQLGHRIMRAPSNTIANLYVAINIPRESPTEKECINGISTSRVYSESRPEIQV